jgi:L-alanine-DL-glutamate epimerase-like enolase superfamily enzyme
MPTFADLHSTPDVDKPSAIKRIEVRQIKYPMTGVGRGGIDLERGTGERTRLAIRIETKDGSVGAYVGSQAQSHAQTLTCARIMLGRDALARQEAYEFFKRALGREDRMGAGVVDIALWDLAGHRAGMSVSQLLGGWRKSLKAYASTWFSGDGEGGLGTPEQHVAFAEECYELGYRGYKVHGWTDGSTHRDIETIRLLGQQFEGRMALMHDSGCMFQTWGDAVKVGQACDEAGFFWYEDPYSDEGQAAFAYQKMRSMVKTPLLMGEHVRGLESIATFVLAGGTDMVRADPDFDMGITGALKIATFAEALGLDVELHAPGPAQRALMSAIRNTNFYELSMVGPSRGNFNAPVYACGYSDALDDVSSDGTFPVPQGFGRGVTYDWEAIEELTVHKAVIE